MVGGSVVGLEDATSTVLVLGIVFPRVWAAISLGSGVPRPIPHALLGVFFPDRCVLVMSRELLASNQLRRRPIAS